MTRTGGFRGLFANNNTKPGIANSDLAVISQVEDLHSAITTTSGQYGGT